jgi:methyl-accepting chemotaxis protein
MKWFLNLNAALKLTLSSGICLFITAIIGIEGLSMMSEMNRRLDIMYSRYFDGMVLTKGIEVAKMDAARSSRNAILKIGDGAAIEKERKDLAALLKLIREDLAKAEALADRPATKAQLATIRRVLPDYQQKTERIFEMAEAGDSKAAKAALEANAPVIKTLNQAVRLAAESQKEAAAENMAENQRAYSRARRETLALLCGAIVFSLTLSLWIARIFSAPLGKTMAVLNEVAQGDLTKRLDVDSQDEVGRMAEALNRALASIRETLAEVSDASHSVGAASQELAQATQKIAAGVQQQSASLDETSASLEELTQVRHQRRQN